MTITLDQLLEHQDRLRREIVERECLLAAFDVLQGYMAKGKGPASVELGTLVSALARFTPALSLPEEAATVPVPVPAILPAPPPVKRYVNPEFETFQFRGHGRNSKLVWWAIQRMTADYSLRDIQTLLEREGGNLRSAEISTVLTRLKARGEIEEIRRSAGPYPALFRGPENQSDPEPIAQDSTSDAEMMAGSLANT
jgi:hypothetical protein